MRKLRSGPDRSLRITHHELRPPRIPMIDSVLMIGFGGPTKPEEIRPFLANVVRGRNVPAERLEEVAHHYEAIGGRSPYNELTFRQAEAMRAQIADRGMQLAVDVGIRNTTTVVYTNTRLSD